MTAKIVKGKGAKTRSGAMEVETGGVVHKRVLDAREKAAKIVSEAEKEAAGIKSEAKKTLADARKQRDEELKRGFAEGESKGLAQVTEKLVAMERLREKFYEEAEPELVKLSMAAAEKVIGKLAGESADLIRNVVIQALEKTLGDRIVVRLNPEDYNGIMAGGHDFKEHLDRTKRLTLRSDDAITRGGCIVESEIGTIDAQLEIQLEAIRKALEI